MKINSTPRLVLLSVTGIFFLSAVFYFLIPLEPALSDEQARAKAEEMIFRLKEVGLPTDFESLNQLYKSRTNPENAAAWIRILEYLSSIEFMNSSLHVFPFERASPPFDNYLAVEKKLLKDNSAILSDVHRLASNKEPVRFEFDYAKSFSTYYDLTGYFTNRAASRYDYSTAGEFSKLQQVQLQLIKAIELLACEMHVGILERDSAAVLESLITQMNVLSLTQGEDLLVNHLRNAKLQSLILNNVRIAIEVNVLTERELELLLAELQEIPSSVQTWTRIIQYERAWALPYLQGHVAMVLEPDNENSKKRPATLTGNELLRFVEGFDEYEHINWSSWSAAKLQLKECERNQSRERSVVLENRVVERVFFKWLETAELLARNVSERNQAIIGCSLQLYFRKNGVFPQDLSQLKEIGIDPALFKSVADELFGYQNSDGEAYLWGPRQEGVKEPFVTSSTIPKNFLNPSEPVIITKTIWKLNSQ